MKMNLHSHTYLCKHASGKPVDYIKKAIDENFAIYGISDHAYLPESVKRRRTEYSWLNYQMEKNEFEKYISDVDEAIKIYGDQIQIYKALEVEYTLNNDEYYREMLSKLDYLVLGIHFLYNDNKIMGTRGLNNSPDELELYCQNAIDGMESGYFSIFAHPDIFMYGRDCFDQKAEEISRRMIKSAIKNKVVLEINCGGIRKGYYEGNPFKYYPVKEFWKIASEYEDLMVVIGLDSHNVSDLTDGTYEIAMDLAKEFNIKLIDSINFKNK